MLKILKLFSIILLSTKKMAATYIHSSPGKLNPLLHSYTSSSIMPGDQSYTISSPGKLNNHSYSSYSIMSGDQSYHTPNPGKLNNRSYSSSRIVPGDPSYTTSNPGKLNNHSYSSFSIVSGDQSYTNSSPGKLNNHSYSSFSLVPVEFGESSSHSSLSYHNSGSGKSYSYSYSSSSSAPCNPGPKCNCGFMRKPRSCLELQQRGYNTSGVYNIAPCDKQPCDEVEVYCDMETDGGGWTVFQNRGKDTAMDFNRTFREYAYGFGNTHTDFWLGNEYIHCLTSQTYTQMMVVMKDWCNRILKEYYSCFFLSDWNSRYELRLKNVTVNNSTDSLMPHSNAKFSTYDLDTANKRACHLGGGWWHTAPNSNLNGIYRSREDSKFCCQQRNNLMKQSVQSCKKDGIFWRKWHGTTYSLMNSTMMLRGRDPHNYHEGLKCCGIDTGFCQTSSLISEATIWIYEFNEDFLRL